MYYDCFSHFLGNEFIEGIIRFSKIFFLLCTCSNCLKINHISLYFTYQFSITCDNKYRTLFQNNCQEKCKFKSLLTDHKIYLFEKFRTRYRKNSLFYTYSYVGGFLYVFAGVVALWRVWMCPTKLTDSTYVDWRVKFQKIKKVMEG